MGIRYTLPNGTVLTGGAFAIAVSNGKTYNFPQNWLELATATDLAHWGIRAETTPDPPPPPAPRRVVPKTVIIDRLQEAGKLKQARAALDAADLYTRERWNSRDAIYADDETAAALLRSIGADPAVIMAEVK